MVQQNTPKIPSPSFRGLHAASLLSSRTKRANRNKDTSHELLLRRELWQLGLRYRKHAKHLPAKPDILFVNARVAVFCDGDFWHGRYWRRLKQNLRDGSNPAYWVKKIASNIQRDNLTTKALKTLGWHVLRVWETDIQKDPKTVAQMIALCIRKRGPRPSEHSL